MLDLEKKDIAFADTAEAGWKRIRKDDKCLPIQLKNMYFDNQTEQFTSFQKKWIKCVNFTLAWSQPPTWAVELAGICMLWSSSQGGLL